MAAWTPKISWTGPFPSEDSSIIPERTSLLDSLIEDMVDIIRHKIKAEINK